MNQGMSGKLYIKTFGCQMNEYDSSKMADVLAESHGLTVTNDPSEADVLLVNTCSVREKAQEKVFSLLGTWRPFKELRPGVVIGKKGEENLTLEGLSGIGYKRPFLGIAMTIFLFSLAGIPPLGGWFAKFEVFRVLATAGEPWGYVLAAVGAVNSVIALYYYASLARRMWADDVPDGDHSPVLVTPSLVTALTLCGAVTLAFGVAPQLVARFTDVSLLALGG